jgi:diguanylate cyclase (GGDEF)-like protein
MAVDINKQLDKAKKYLERNKLAEAAEAYQSVVNELPGHSEGLQGLGDIYTRLGQVDRAATYYGTLFDRLCDVREENKALALYTRALRGTQQPPERMVRYAYLLQKQGRSPEAVELYVAASELLLARGKADPALDCLERVAQLEPESAARQVAAGRLAEQMGKHPAAVRAYLRAAQLSEASKDTATALELLKRAHQLAPTERSPALLYAQALLRQGQAEPAVGLLEPHSGSDADAAVLNSLGEALTAVGDLDRARTILERLLPLDPATMGKLFDLANRYLAGHQDDKAAALLASVQTWAHSARKQGDFATRLDGLAEAYPRSARLAEFCAAAYAALNRESGYFNALVRLFDIYCDAGEMARAADALDKLAEIDPYDQGHQQRLARLEGSADPELVRRIRARIQQVSTHSGAPAPESSGPEASGETVVSSTAHALDDLIVQAEIFLQYSLQAKALEKLQQIAQMFPGEEARDERLRSLYQMAGWWPSGSPESSVRRTEAGAQTDSASSNNADTMRDLAKISEISQSLHRQASAKGILATAIQEVGQHLRATRCFVAIGAPGGPPQMASEYCAPGAEPAPGAVLVRLLAQLDQTTPNALGGLLLQRNAAPVLADLGMDSALGVPVIDPETKAQAGLIVAGYSGAHAWRPHEGYFLQAVGDQVLLGVNHMRLRTMTRSLRAADEKTGFLMRSSYLDCLLQEAQRAKTQGASLTLVLMQMDHGAELMRQHGEAAMERHLEQLARALQPITRQSDLTIKYTSWSIAVILPDTPRAAGEQHAEKIRQAGKAVHPPWEGQPIGWSVSVCDAIGRPDYDAEDIVTELINRAEAGLDEAAVHGGDVAVCLGVPILQV